MPDAVLKIPPRPAPSAETARAGREGGRRAQPLNEMDHGPGGGELLATQACVGMGVV